MKTIYTDTYGILPWMMVAIAVWRAASSIGAAVGGTWTWALFDAIVAGIALYLGLKRFAERRRARLEGRDPTIVRIKNDD
ncbi:MAG: hypothetical protein ABIT10_13580 [Alteraurantiacibacter sp.]